jgi:hypothetical protein
MRVKHYKPRKDRCLDSVTVRAIREQYDVHGRSRRSIALEYGLNEGVIRAIVENKTYRNV